MTAAAKETVVVVHGTWAGPETGAVQWWQPPQHGMAEHFTTRLDEALARRGSPARCWTGTSQTFSWSGRNAWLHRTQAAADLAAFLKTLTDNGVRYHLVGHSHGGNVIADALPSLQAGVANSTLGRVVTLGTPFVDTTTPIERRKLSWQTTITRASYLLATVALIAFAKPFIGPPMSMAALPDNLSLFVGVSAAIAVAMWMLYSRAINRLRAPRNPLPPGTGLAISSPYDEAWQVLYHLREAANPLAVPTGVIRHLFRQSIDHVARRRQVGRLHGSARWLDLSLTGKAMLLLFYGLAIGMPIILAQDKEAMGSDTLIIMLVMVPMMFLVVALYAVIASTMFGPKFISAFWMPVRGVTHMASLVWKLPSEIATYIARNKAWKLLQSAALGLDGYDMDLPRVEQLPAQTGQDVFRFERLQDAAEKRALGRRAKWIEENLGDVTETFSKLAISANDVSALLVSIEKDATLVHAAYYTDPECIERIADWIAGSSALEVSPPSQAAVLTAVPAQ
jgi:hypothetical protein